jgi:hypothetical protein
VKRFAANARGQWTIETQLHWRLDVAFDEDRSRLRKDHAAENFAVVRHIALNLLKRVDAKKKSIKVRRKRCGWDRDFLLQVIGLGCANATGTKKTASPERPPHGGGKKRTTENSRTGGGKSIEVRHQPSPHRVACSR